MAEVSYVGTRGKDLVSRSNGNVMPYGVLNSGTFNGIDLSNPVNRYAVASEGTNLSRFRQFNALNAITLYDFRGDSQLRLDAGHPEPADRTAAAVLRGLHVGTHRGHARRRVLAHRPVRSEPDPRRPGRGSDARPEHFLECVPARWRQGLIGQCGSAAGC